MGVEPVYDLRDLGSTEAEKKRRAELMAKIKAAPEMTPDDYRRQLKSYALGAAKTPEDRERLSKEFDRQYGTYWAYDPS